MKYSCFLMSFLSQWNDKDTYAESYVPQTPVKTAIPQVRLNDGVFYPPPPSPSARSPSSHSFNSLPSPPMRCQILPPISPTSSDHGRCISPDMPSFLPIPPRHKRSLSSIRTLGLKTSMASLLSQKSEKPEP